MEQFFTCDLTIAEIPIRLCSDQPLDMEEAFLPFRTKPREGAVSVIFRQSTSLPVHPPHLLLEENCYRVYADEDGSIWRGFYDVHHKSVDYALARPTAHDGVAVDYLPWGWPFVRSLSNAFFHIGFERLLIRKQKLCLHAALVRTAFGGLLFSGPSGIGKSTQAGLWCQLEHAAMINGDRPVIGRKNGSWYGWGSPYAGSSRCYVNEACPIAAVVMLRQAPICRLRRLPLQTAFRQIYAGLTVNSWDPDFSVAAFDLAVQLASEVPVYELACTPDAAAVTLLKTQLRKDGECDGRGQEPL